MAEQDKRTALSFVQRLMDYESRWGRVHPDDYESEERSHIQLRQLAELEQIAREAVAGLRATASFDTLTLAISRELDAARAERDAARQECTILRDVNTNLCDDAAAVAGLLPGRTGSLAKRVAEALEEKEDECSRVVIATRELSIRAMDEIVALCGGRAHENEPARDVVTRLEAERAATLQREAEARAEAARLRAEMARAAPLHECAHLLGGTQCLRCDMDRALSAPGTETLRALRELVRVADAEDELDDIRSLYLRSAEEPCECGRSEYGCPSCSTFESASRRLDAYQKRVALALAAVPWLRRRDGE